MDNNYKLLFDNISLGIIFFDENLKILDCNQHIQKIAGIYGEFILGYDLKLLPNKSIVSAFESAVHEKEGYYEGSFSNENLYLKSILIKTKPLAFQHNNLPVFGGIGLIEDITEQKIIEEAVNKSFKTFQTVLDNVDLLVYVVDPVNKEILFMNEKSRLELGDKIGKNYKYIFDGTENSLSFFYNKEHKKNESNIYEHELYDERLKKWYKYSSTYITWIDEREVLLVSAMDITLLKKIEAEVLEKNSELEFQKVEIERAMLTVVEQNSKISKQSEQLRLASHVKDKMFAIIGHDVRGPVGNIKNILDLLMEEYDTYSKDQIREFIEPVIDTAGSAYNLLANLLSWAKSQTGKIIFSPEVFRISEAIEENTRLFLVNFQKKKIGLNIDMEKDYKVYADENMITTVIRNLISNAIKFTPKKGNVFIKVKKIDGTNKILIIIEDTGIGISSDKIDKILNKREIFSTYGTDNEKGSGLGTILCREFVKKNGGELSIEGVEGKGSKFSFTLPTG